ncbi:hypothetical protein GZH79_13030 [Loktanella sp. SALINAS62]|nr:type I restriction-modification enzyme R subunit C-terminal domain-containing protein [Loktanella sp. SALINAS62]MBS1303242.1 hypothetical protein [Loktanella sp. SALINAS62]
MVYDPDQLEDMRRLIDAPNSDNFDVLAYIRFTLAPLARSDRAEAARERGHSGYENEMRAFPDYVLQTYDSHGIDELAPRKIADFLRIQYGAHLVVALRRETGLKTVTCQSPRRDQV